MDIIDKVVDACTGNYESDRDADKAEKKAKHERALAIYRRTKVHGTPFLRRQKVLDACGKMYYEKYSSSADYDLETRMAFADASFIAMNRRYAVYNGILISAFALLILGIIFA